MNSKRITYRPRTSDAIMQARAGNFIRTIGFAECPECFGIGGHYTYCDKTK